MNRKTLNIRISREAYEELKKWSEGKTMTQALDEVILTSRTKKTSENKK